MYRSSGNVSGHLSSPGSSGGGGGAATPRSSGGNGYPLQHPQVYQPVMVPVPPPPAPPSQMFFSASRGGDDDSDFPFSDAEWGNQEIRDFIEIRAQLEWNFSVGNNNKDLWETVANRMRERGHLRTAEQCRWKWKFLKEQEVSNLGDDQQSLFYDEMHSVSSVQTTRMVQQHALESEMVRMRDEKRAKKSCGDEWNQECSLEHEDAIAAEATVPRKKTKKEKQPKSVENEIYLTPTPVSASNGGYFIKSIKEIMRKFIQQQQNIDMQWRKRMEKQAEERELFEREWRQKMENLENEKLKMERTQSEYDEQRRVRVEIRAEKADALLTALLKKLIKDEIQS